jgi:polynucleotide 5'-hydroxyl-kinase GRC3/NOL9
VVLVVGGVDVGKSTFCTYLANTALKRGLMPYVIDGDIGQGDIAPPTAIGAASVTKPILDLRDLDASFFAFIGTISPAGIETLVAQRLGGLSRQVRDFSPLQIINTDGYIRDGGLQYKRMVCDEIQPDVVVSLDGDPELDDATKPGTWKLVKVKASMQAKKTWSDRKWRRYHQFLRFVSKGGTQVDISRIDCRYLGRLLPRSHFSSSDPIDPTSGLTGVFVGLEWKGQVRGFGVIESIDVNHAQMRTDLREFDCIHLSNIRLEAGRAEQVNWRMQDRGFQSI